MEHVWDLSRVYLAPALLQSHRQRMDVWFYSVARHGCLPCFNLQLKSAARILSWSGTLAYKLQWETHYCPQNLGGTWRNPAGFLYLQYDIHSQCLFWHLKKSARDSHGFDTAALQLRLQVWEVFSRLLAEVYLPLNQRKPSADHSCSAKTSCICTDPQMVLRGTLWNHQPWIIMSAECFAFAHRLSMCVLASVSAWIQAPARMNLTAEEILILCVEGAPSQNRRFT